MILIKYILPATEAAAWGHDALNYAGGKRIWFFPERSIFSTFHQAQHGSGDARKWREKRGTKIDLLTT